MRFVAVKSAERQASALVFRTRDLLVRQRTSGSLAPSQLATALLLHPDSLASGSTRHVNGLKDLLAQSVSSTRSGQLRVILGIRPAAAGTPAGPAGTAPQAATTEPAGHAGPAGPAGGPG